MKLAMIAVLLLVTVSGCDGENSSDPRVDAAFESVDCPAALERGLDDSYYQGPMIDTHMHIAPIPDEIGGTSSNPLMGVDVRTADYVCMMDYEGTSKVFAFFPVWEPITLELLEIVNRTMTDYPDRGWSASWSVDTDVALTLNNYIRAFIGRLDSSVQEKFAYWNAERLIQSGD